MSPELLGATVVVGVAGGVAGSGYLLVLHLLQRGLAPEHWSTAAVVVILTLTGFAVVVLTRLLGPPGDVELLVDNIHVSGGASDIRSLRSLVPMSLLTIAAGGAAGPEAPLVTTCGSLSGVVARGRGLDTVETRCVTIAGMAAAFAVLFGAPVGAALFALEILHRRGLQYSEALLPAVIGSLSGFGCFLALHRAGIGPVWHIPGGSAVRGVDYAWALAAGVGGAVIAVAFTFLTLGLRHLFRRMPRSARPVLGGIALGLVGAWSSYGLTFGEAQTAHVLTVPLAAGVLAVAVVAKLVGSAVTVSSGWPGGFIIPLFFMGAAAGQLAQHAVPGANVAVLCAALMAAANVGVTKTLLGSTLVVTEMTGLRLLPTTLLAATVCFLLTSGVGLIESQRERSR